MSAAASLIAFPAAAIVLASLLRSPAARRLVSPPRADRWNTEPTPHLGGIGIFAGFVLHVLNLLDLPKPRQDAIVAGGSFVACVALICAALFLEYCCRVPGKPEDEE